jgi:nucleotide-binding universal stress UspA family protein
MRHFPMKILLATDGSQDAALALRAALDLSSSTGSELHVVHAWQAFTEYSHPSMALTSDSALYEREAQEVLVEQLDKIEDAGAIPAGAHLKRGRAAETIIDVGQDLGAGLIVMGSRGLGPIRRLVMGSVTEGVVDLATCPVLVVRGGEGTWPPSRIVAAAVGNAGGEHHRRHSAVAGQRAGQVGTEDLTTPPQPEQVAGSYPNQGSRGFRKTCTSGYLAHSSPQIFATFTGMGLGGFRTTPPRSSPYPPRPTACPFPRTPRPAKGASGREPGPRRLRRLQ